MSDILCFPPVTDAEHNLKETVQPTRWEHLAGPFRWFTAASEPYKTDDGRTVQTIRVANNPIGTIVKHLARTKRENGRPVPPYKSILFHGPKGTGKSAFEELLARTFLAKSHEPVSYPDQNDEPVYLVDEQGNPFVINPPEDQAGDPSNFVRRALSSERLDASNCVFPYNAGDMGGIDGLRDMIRQIKRAPLAGNRKVFFFQEIDSLTVSQVKPIKTGLDPAKGIPDGVLLLSNTNNYQSIKNSWGATMDRFQEHLGIDPWAQDELAGAAWFYCNAVGVDFDISTFEREYDAYWRLAEASYGSIRELLGHLESLRGITRKVSQQELSGILSRSDARSHNTSADGEYFFNLNSYSGQVMAEWVQQRIKRGVNIYSFVQSITAEVNEKYPESLQDPNVASALERIVTLAARSADGLEASFYVAMVHPLRQLGQSVRAFYNRDPANY